MTNGKCIMSQINTNDNGLHSAVDICKNIFLLFATAAPNSQNFPGRS